MIYLLPIKHSVYQKTNNPSLIKKLTKYLNQVLKSYQINFVADEWSKDATSINGKESNIKSIVDGKVEYREIDISLKMQGELGIKDLKQIRSDLDLEGKVYSTEPGCKNVEKDNDDYRINELYIEEQKKREPFWYKNIEDVLDRNILFICGSSHIESFSGLLVDKGLKVEVLPPNLKISNQGDK